MRTLIAAMMLLFSTQHAIGALGTPEDSDCPAATGIPATFAAGGAEIVSGITGKTHTQFQNSSDVDICFCYHTDVAADCDTDGKFWCLPPSSSMTRDDHQSGDFIRAKYKSGAPTSGFVCAGAW